MHSMPPKKAGRHPKNRVKMRLRGRDVAETQTKHLVIRLLVPLGVILLSGLGATVVDRHGYPWVSGFMFALALAATVYFMRQIP